VLDCTDLILVLLDILEDPTKIGPVSVIVIVFVVPVFGSVTTIELLVILIDG